MKQLTPILIAAVAGIVIGAGGLWLAGGGTDSGVEQAAGERKPLYWVAPMDPSYRRDKPGKSPMGMDLIPVYDEAGAAADAPGTVRISPDVVNNLGVRTAEVERGRLAGTVRTTGYVQYDEDRLVRVHPRVEGWIERLHVEASGDPVQAGEPLYAIYSPTLVNAQEEFLLALKRNNPVLIQAAQERLQALKVPSEHIERLRASGKVGQAITITAPRSGVVDNLNVREGMFVRPDVAMMTIGALDRVWVIGEILEGDVREIREGDPVALSFGSSPGREWGGEVDYVYPSLNPKTRTARVRVGVDNGDGALKPGMFARMTITTRPGEEAWLVPLEALIRTGQQSRVVLALGEGRFKSIAVTVGRVGDRQVEILAGLEAGDSVVTSAQFLIDSESSKTSDFERMYHGDHTGDGDDQ